MSQLTDYINQYGHTMSTPMSLGAPQNQNNMNDTLTKITDWVKNNMMIVIIVAVVYFMFGGKNSRGKNAMRSGYRRDRNRFNSYRSNRRMRRFS